MQLPCSARLPVLLGSALLSSLSHAGGQHALVGRPAKVQEATRTVELSMDDRMRFSPQEIRIKRGETVRFVVHNAGRLKHEMVLGSDKEIKAHAKLMAQFPTMEHDDPNSVTVTGGMQGELTWTFTRSGTFTFACLLPGHFDAGMHGRIIVN